MDPDPHADALLAERDPKRSWRLLLEHHVDTVYRACARATQDEDEGRDLAAEVLRRLSERWPATIQRFRPDGGASFRTWLAVVARNLAIDVLRSLHGRRGIPKPVAAMGDPSRRIWELAFHQAQPLPSAWETLRDAGHFDGDFAAFCDEVRAIDVALPPSARLPDLRRVSLDPGLSAAEPAQPADAAPDRLASRRGLQEALRAALADLAGDERTLLRVYFLDGSTAAELQCLLGAASRSRVYNRVHELMRKLRTLVIQHGLGPEDKEHLTDFDWHSALDREDAP